MKTFTQFMETDGSAPTTTTSGGTSPVKDQAPVSKEKQRRIVTSAGVCAETPVPPTTFMTKEEAVYEDTKAEQEFHDHENAKTNNQPTPFVPPRKPKKFTDVVREEIERTWSGERVTDYHKKRGYYRGGGEKPEWIEGTGGEDLKGWKRIHQTRPKLPSGPDRSKFKPAKEELGAKQKEAAERKAEEKRQNELIKAAKRKAQLKKALEAAAKERTLHQKLMNKEND
jgi:hypothetical protein